MVVQADMLHSEYLVVLVQVVAIQEQYATGRHKVEREDEVGLPAGSGNFLHHSQ